MVEPMDCIHLQTVTGKSATLSVPFTLSQLVETAVEMFGYCADSVKVKLDDAITTLSSVDEEGPVELSRLGLTPGVDRVLVFGVGQSARPHVPMRAKKSTRKRSTPSQLGSSLRGSEEGSVVEMRKEEFREKLAALNQLANRLLACQESISAFILGVSGMREKVAVDINQTVLQEDKMRKEFFASDVLHYIANRHEACMERGNGSLFCSPASIPLEDSLYAGGDSEGTFFYLESVLRYIFRHFPPLFEYIQKNAAEFVSFLNKKAHRDFYLLTRACSQDEDLLACVRDSITADTLVEVLDDDSLSGDEDEIVIDIYTLFTEDDIEGGLHLADTGGPNTVFFITDQEEDQLRILESLDALENVYRAPYPNPTDPALLTLNTDIKHLYSLLISNRIINTEGDFVLSKVSTRKLDFFVSGTKGRDGSSSPATQRQLVGILHTIHSQIQSVITDLLSQAGRQLSISFESKNLSWLIDISFYVLTLCERFYLYTYDFAVNQTEKDPIIGLQVFGRDRTVSPGALACRCALARLLIVELSELCFKCSYQQTMREKGGSDGGAVVDSNSPKRRLDSLYPPRVGALRALPIDFSPLMDPMVRFLTPKGPTELLTHMMDRASSGRITACPVFLYVNHFLTQNSDFNIVCDHLCYVFRENGSISAKSLFTTTHNSKASLMESVKTCDSLPEFYADRIQSQLAEKGVVDKELSTRWTDVMKELYESYVTPIVKYLPSPKISKKPIYIVDCRHLTVLKDMEDVPQVVEAQINRRETTDAKSSPPPDTHKYPRQPGAVRWFGGYTNKRLETCVERWCIVGCDSPWQLVQSFENPPCSSPKTSKSLLYLYDSGTANTVLRTAPEWLRGDIFVNLQFRRYPLPGVVFQPREHVVVLHELDTRRSELEKVEESPLSLSSNSVVTHKRLSISGNGLSPVFVGDLRVIEECDRSLLSTYKATIFHNVDFEGNPTHKPSVNRRCYLDYFYSALVENPRWSIAALHHSAVSAVMKHGRDTKQPQPWRAVEYVLYDDGAPLSSLESLMYIDVEKKPKPTGVMFPTAKKLNPHALAPLRRTKPPEMTPIPPKTTVSLPTTPRSTKKGGRLPSLTSTEALPPTSTGSAALSDADYLEEKKVRQVFENLLVSATESNAKTEREAVDSFIRCLETNTDDSMTEVNRNVTVLKDVTNAKELCPICKEGYHHWQNCPNTAKRGKK